MRNFFAVPKTDFATSLLLLLLRVVVGLAFMYHGWSKVQNPFAWMGPDSGIPGPLLALAALSEFGGGLALILGALNRLASLGLVSTMGVAVYMHWFQWGHSFVAKGKSFELPLVYLCVALLFVAVGPGQLSFDRFAFGNKRARL